MKCHFIYIGLVFVLLLQPANNEAQPVTQIAAGSQSLFLKSDGSLWAMGNNSSGELGDGTTNNADLPELIVSNGVTAIAAGISHSLFLKRDGSLWAMGKNANGQLGDGTTNNSDRPELIISNGVMAIAAGAAHSLLIKTNGSLWAMGDNLTGELGDGTYLSTNRPEQILGGNVSAIAAAGSFSLFIKTDGSLWGMGDNYYGNLGDGTFNSTNRPEQIEASNVVAIAAGGEIGFSLFLKTSGSLWAMGVDSSGQLGDGQPIFGLSIAQTNLPEQIVASNVTTISAGFDNSMFVKNDGSLWVMGDNDFGQLGEGFIAYPTNLPVELVPSGVTKIAAGVAYNLFLRNEGSLWGMGDNFYGELGDGVFSNDGVDTGLPAAPPLQILGPYNQISGQLLNGTNMQLSFEGIAGANYALDRSSDLSPANWVPQATNSANAIGVLIFSNPPNAVANNFWRIRSVP
ncbi:MAG: hypothetical protein ABSE48_16150 [Verrucomicrobiota bacterium]|jgi:alpha-tubulin suppressor-like RCC1 family protein